MISWVLFCIYLLGTTWLGFQGYRKTRDFSSFAIGHGDISPFQVGVTLAAATASAATFIINPGFVYVDGLAAFMHLGISVYLGFVFMLSILSFKFRELGAGMKAMTIPDWVGKRYESNNFSLYFGFINLLSFAFVVLLVGGTSIVMQNLLGIGHIPALLITIIFVTGYVLLGGTYAHVYTNMLQGLLMIAVAIVVIGTGIYYSMNSPSPDLPSNYWSWVNPDSRFYSDIFSTYISGFIIGAALVCQPHILTKALYVKSNREVKKYILIFSVVFFLFILLLLAGYWAHFLISDDQLVDATTGAFRQDLVMTTFLREAFPKWVFDILSVVLLAASMSTLDGLLVGISTITANDVYLNLAQRKNKEGDQEGIKQKGISISQWVLVIIAVAAFLISIQPPELLGIFGQVGVYGLVVATVPPLLIGVLFERVELKSVWIGSVLAVVLYFAIFIWQDSIGGKVDFDFQNPAVPATIALLIIVAPLLIIHYRKN